MNRDSYNGEPSSDGSPAQPCSSSPNITRPACSYGTHHQNQAGKEGIMDDPCLEEILAQLSGIVCEKVSELQAGDDPHPVVLFCSADHELGRRLLAQLGFADVEPDGWTPLLLMTREQLRKLLNEQLIGRPGDKLTVLPMLQPHAFHAIAIFKDMPSIPTRPALARRLRPRFRKEVERNAYFVARRGGIVAKRTSSDRRDSRIRQRNLITGKEQPMNREFLFSSNLT